LRRLKLDEFSTEEWRLEDGTMPRLSRLELGECRKMSRLPEGLLHLPSLNYVELFKMPLISEYDSTWKKLRQNGCEVRTYM
jgi:hypothetical protein